MEEHVKTTPALIAITHSTRSTLIFNHLNPLLSGSTNRCREKRITFIREFCCHLAKVPTTIYRMDRYRVHVRHSLWLQPSAESSVRIPWARLVRSMPKIRNRVGTTKHLLLWQLL